MKSSFKEQKLNHNIQFLQSILKKTEQADQENYFVFI